jgi:hypothetical protein
MLRVRTVPIVKILATKDVKNLNEYLKEVVASSDTDSLSLAKSCCWAQAEKLGEGGYTLTVLGFLNGIISALTGKCLVRIDDDTTGEIIGYEMADTMLKGREGRE